MQRDRAVIFDLDGTLLDTLGDIADSMNTVLGRSGLPPHTRETYLSFIGEGMDVLVRRALPEDMRDEKTVSRFVLSMREEYDRRWAQTSQPYQGVPELLSLLTEKGIPFAVLSNKLDSFTKIMVERFLGAWRFFDVRGLIFGMPRKPDPALALEIASDMKILPARIFFVGDSDIDVKTALNAGMTPVGVSWGYQSVDRLTASGAKTILARPQELLDHL
ncbi:MAG TPA: HAD family hydrolase [Deltaproteobacteria bacterium]|nr:HAD family hydrolase [Deltaproteobacteria bacterium]HQI00529.1 HAD family hydrolase [Deltaproteobacteria bacterium]